MKKATYYHHGKRVNKRSILQGHLDSAAYYQYCAAQWARGRDTNVPRAQDMARAQHASSWWTLTTILKRDWGPENYVKTEQ